MTEILIREEAEKLDSFIEYKDGTYAYNKNNGYWHLIKDGKDLFEGKNVYAYYYYQNKGTYDYQDGTGDWHVNQDGINEIDPYENKPETN